MPGAAYRRRVMMPARGLGDLPAIFASLGADAFIWSDANPLRPAKSGILRAYQESTGLTPVTAAAQAVGLVIDESQGAAIGAELLPPLDDDLWSDLNVVSSTPTGFTTGSGTAAKQLTSATTPGGLYRLLYALENSNSVQFRIINSLINDSTTPNVVISSSPSIAGALLHLSEGTYFRLRVADATVISDASLSLKRISGRHLYQLTAGSKPTMRGVGSTADPFCLEGDGGDHLSFAAPWLYAAGQAIMVFAVKAPAQSNTYLFGSGNSASATPNYGLSSYSGGGLRISARNDANTTVLDANGAAGALDDTWKIVTVIDTGSHWYFRVNGQANADGSYTRSGAMTLNQAALMALPRTTVTNQFTGRMIPIVLADKVPDLGTVAYIERMAGRIVGLSI